MPAGTMGHRGNWRGPTEPMTMGRQAKWAAADTGGPPRSLTETQQEGLTTSNPLFRVSPSRSSRFLFFSALPQYPTFRRFRNACYWFGGRDIGVRRKAIGHNEPLRNPPEPDGTPRNTNRRHCALKSAYLSRFLQLCSSRFPLHPVPIPRVSAVSKRLVLVVVVGGANTGATSKESGQNGPPRNQAEPHGAPTGGHYATKSAIFVVFALWILSFPPFPHSSNTQHFGGFENPRIGLR